MSLELRPCDFQTAAQFVGEHHRHNDKIAFSFGRDERTDYSVLAERFYDDYYTVGTAMYPYNRMEES